MIKMRFAQTLKTNSRLAAPIMFGRQKFALERSEKDGRMHWRRRCKYNTPEGLCLQVSCGKERRDGRGRARLNAGLMRRECSKMGWGKNSSSLAGIKVSPFSAEFDTTPLSIRDPLFALAEPAPLPHKTCPITLNWSSNILSVPSRPSPIIIGPFPSLL